MINSAGRLELVVDLYMQGLLCKCNKTEKVIYEHPVHGDVYKDELVHNKDCDGRAKIMELLFDCKTNR